MAVSAFNWCFLIVSPHWQTQNLEAVATDNKCRLISAWAAIWITSKKVLDSLITMAFRASDNGVFLLTVLAENFDFLLQLSSDDMAEKQVDRPTFMIFAFNNTLADGNRYFLPAISTVPSFILLIVHGSRMLTLQQIQMKGQQINKKNYLKPQLSDESLQREAIQARNLRTPEMDEIFKLKSKFQRAILDPIQVIEDLSQNKMPQKCMIHNNNYTLYCEQDRKPLCASCIYQNNAHKAHRVTPLSSCLENIRKDSHRYELQLENIIYNVTGLVQHVNKGISKMEAEFPKMVFRIEEAYQNLHEYLIEKEKEHTNELRYYRDKMKYQHGALSVELNKISVYIDEKIRQYSKKQDNEGALAKRNVFDVLRQSTKLIGEELKSTSEESFKISYDIFGQIEDLMTGKFMNLIIKEPSTKSKNTSLTPSKKKTLPSSTPSKEKLSHSPPTKSKKNLHSPDSNAKRNSNKNLKTEGKSPIKKTERSTSRSHSKIKNDKVVRKDSPNRR